MNGLDDTLIGQCQQRHTHVEWLKFLKQIDRETPKNKALQLRRGVCISVPELVSATNEYMALHNKDPEPFIWTKSARDILEKVIRANSRLCAKQNATPH